MRIYKKIHTLKFNDSGECIGILRTGRTPHFDVINTHTYEDLINIVKRDNPMCDVRAYWTGDTLTLISFLRDEEWHDIFLVQS